MMVARSKAKGIEAVRTEVKNREYSKELKHKAVRDSIDGKGSQIEICTRYEIKAKSTLQDWIKCYNSGKDFKERSRSERGVTMKKAGCHRSCRAFGILQMVEKIAKPQPEN